jgi:hypothetical protein
MKNMLKISIRLSLHLVAASALLSAGVVRAAPETTVQNTDAITYSIAPLKERYPTDSIQSAESARSALKDVQEARTRIEARYTAEQHACYPKFFTTSCLDKATEHRRKDLAAIRPIEVEANAFIRKSKVVESDRRLAEKAAQNEADAAQRAKDGEHKALVIHDKEATDQRDAISREAQRQKRADEAARKVAEHAAKEQQRKAHEEKDAEQRAANIVKYNKKVHDAEMRQKDVAQKKAERERQRADKAAKAAKDQAVVPAAP